MQCLFQINKFKLIIFELPLNPMKCMNNYFQSVIKNVTGATAIYKIEVIQNLWSGYGEILRYGLEDAPIQRVVVKHVRLEESGKHPRGWNSSHSHERKLQSY